MPEEPQQANNQDPLNLFGGDVPLISSLQGLQGQIDKQSQLLQNVIFAVLIAFVFITVTVAVEVIFLHSNGVSEEEYTRALESQKEYTELLIDNKLSEFKSDNFTDARDTIRLESESK